MLLIWRLVINSGGRVEWLDVARGIGILLVIAGHTIQLSWSYPIYAFHLPLFFLITGMLISPDKVQHVGCFLARKARRLLIPWCICFLISFAVTLIVPQWREAISVRNAVKDLYTLNTNFVQNSSLWYLPCLFWALACFCILQRAKRVVLVLGMLIVVIILLWLLMPYMHLPAARLPLKMDSALVGVFFIGSGFWGRNVIVKLCCSASWLWVLLMSIMAGLLCVVNGVANVSAYTFGRCPIAYFPIALCSSILIVATSMLIPRELAASRLLGWFGKNSLIIFCFQSIFIRMYHLIVGTVTGTDLILYGSNPIIHQLGSFCMVAFVLSPILVVCCDKVRLKWLTRA